MHCVGCGDDISKIPSKMRSLCSDSVSDPRATKANIIELHTLIAWNRETRLDLPSP